MSNEDWNANQTTKIFECKKLCAPKAQEVARRTKREKNLNEISINLSEIKMKYRPIELMMAKADKFNKTMRAIHLMPSKSATISN